LAPEHLRTRPVPSAEVLSIANDYQYRGTTPSPPRAAQSWHKAFASTSVVHTNTRCIIILDVAAWYIDGPLPTLQRNPRETWTVPALIPLHLPTMWLPSAAY